MRTVSIPQTDLSLIPLGLGLVDFGIADRGEIADRVLGQFYDGGGRLLDTAHCYGFWKPDGVGCSESCLGDYLKRNGRKDWIVVTKGAHPGAANYRIADDYMSPRRISADIDDSLARLGVDRIDLYFLHRDDRRMPVSEIIDYLNEEVNRGRIRYFGASNWKTDRIEEANEYASNEGLMGFVCSQPAWCLADPVGKRPADVSDIGPGEISWHTRTGLAMTPYHGAAKGFFATNGQKGARGYDSETNRQRLARVQELATKLGHTPNQIAMAWLMNQPFSTIPLISTRNPEHLADALGAVDVRLSSEQMSWLYSG